VWVAPAGAQNVGTIFIDRYQAFSGGGLGGVDLRAHFTLNANFPNQDCCQAGDIRWIQRITSSAATGFTPNPNRPFIDPRQGQNIGGANVGDALPFYDVTYANQNDANNDNNRLANGSGSVLHDSPRVLLARGPYTFFAQTLLVCMEAGMQLGILGGFSWGFTIGAAPGNAVTPTPIAALADGAALRNDFNTALAADFPGWSIVAANTLWPVTTVPTVNVAPEPSSVVTLATGLVMLVYVGRRRVARLRDRHATATAA
jgi:hypothetical protein